MKITSCILILTFSVNLDFVESSSPDDSRRGPGSLNLPVRKRNLPPSNSPSEKIAKVKLESSSESDLHGGPRQPKLPFRRQSHPSSSGSSQPASSQQVSIQPAITQPAGQARSVGTAPKVGKNEHPSDILKLPGRLRVVRMTAENLPGVWIVSGNPETRHPVRFPLDVIIKRNTVLGRMNDYKYYPMYFNDEVYGWSYITMQVDQVGGPAHSPKRYDLNKEIPLFSALPPDTIYVFPVERPKEKHVTPR